MPRFTPITTHKMTKKTTEQPTWISIFSGYYRRHCTRKAAIRFHKSIKGTRFTKHTIQVNGEKICIDEESQFYKATEVDELIERIHCTIKFLCK